MNLDEREARLSKEKLFENVSRRLQRCSETRREREKQEPTIVS